MIVTLKAGINQMPIVDRKRQRNSAYILTKQLCEEFYYFPMVFSGTKIRLKAAT